MELFFIRHKPTGHYLPEPTGYMGRGGSHVEPNADSNMARIFRTERAAKIALTTWLKGKYHVSRGVDYGYGEYYEDHSIEHVPDRKREDMEIVTKKVKL